MTFSEKITDVTKLKHWRGHMEANFLYTTGIPGDEFFKKLMKEDTLLASECPECGTVYLPPRMFCENCFVELGEDSRKELEPRGKVRLYTISRINNAGERLDESEIWAIIDIDGADGGFTHRIKGVDPGEVEIGMRVEAVLKPKDKREGTIKDIEYFKPSE